VSVSQLHLIAEEKRVLLTKNIAMTQALVGAVLGAIGALSQYYKKTH